MKKSTVPKILLFFITFSFLITVNAAAENVKQDGLINSISTQPKKNTFQPGDHIKFFIESSKPSQIKNITYTLLASYNSGKWNAVSQWIAKQTVDYTFQQNGVYSLQINAKDNKGNTQEYWIGQFIIGKSQQLNLIDNASWRPYQVAYQRGAGIEFIIQPVLKTKLDNFDFSLKEADHKSSTWSTVVPWQRGGLPEFYFDKDGIFSLEMDVRKHGASKTTIEHDWLGQFYVGDSTVQRDPLVRELLAHHTKIDLNQTLQDESLAKELFLSVNVLYWQYQKNTLNQKIQLAHQLGIKNLQYVGNTVVLSTEDNTKLFLDLSNSTLSDGIVTISLNLANHPNLKKVFDLTKSFPKQVQIASGITFLVYNHYIYSEVGDRVNRPWLGIWDTHAMCKLIAEQLDTLLNSVGYNVTPLTLAFGKTTKVGSHAVVEMLFNHQYYILDGTMGYLIGPSKQSLLLTKKFANIIAFPQLWNSEGLLTMAPILAVAKLTLQQSDFI